MSNGQADFFRTMLPYARRVSELTGIDPRLVLAQSALETGYGRSAPNFNFFGIKAPQGQGASLMTSEFENGQMVRRNEPFRTYDSPAGSFEDYANLMLRAPRYRPVLEARTLEDQIAAMAASGYATDPEYGRKLSQIASGINLDDPGLIASDVMTALGRGPDVSGMTATERPRPAMNGQPTPTGLLAGDTTQQRRGLGGIFTPDVRDRLSIALEGMSLRPNQGIIELAQQRIGQRREEQQTRQERNATAEWLRSQGRDDLAEGVLSGAVTGAQALTTMQRDATSPDIPASFRALQLQAEQAGLQPGTPEYQEFMLYGGAARDTMPAAFAALDAQARAAGFEPGTPEYQNFMRTQGAGDVAAARAAGTASGRAAIDLTGARVTADRTLALIDLVKNDPALPAMVGPIQGRLPNVSADAQRFASRMSQLQGTAFLEAYNMLRGGGQITEVEGQKAEQAIARLNQAQSEQDFRDALREFEDAVRSGIQKLEAQAGAAGGTTAIATPAAPSAPAENDPLGLR